MRLCLLRAGRGMASGWSLPRTPIRGRSGEARLLNSVPFELVAGHFTTCIGLTLRRSGYREAVLLTVIAGLDPAIQSSTASASVWPWTTGSSPVVTQAKRRCGHVPGPVLRAGASERLEGPAACSKLLAMLRDALLKSAPRHEAESVLRSFLPSRRKPGSMSLQAVRCRWIPAGACPGPRSGAGMTLCLSGCCASFSCIPDLDPGPG